jgi:hypothetical protein
MPTLGRTKIFQKKKGCEKYEEVFRPTHGFEALVLLSQRLIVYKPHYTLLGIQEEF